MYVVAHDPLINCQPNPTSVSRAAVGAVTRILRLWGGRARERHALSLVEERDLRDLGLSRYDVQRELAKPFWQG